MHVIQGIAKNMNACGGFRRMVPGVLKEKIDSILKGILICMEEVSMG
jgi:hypothetical protein